MSEPVFYLSSCDYYHFEKPRACHLIRHMLMNHGKKNVLLVQIVPPVTQDDWDALKVTEEIGYVLLTERHVGTSIYPEVSNWPLYVYILRPLYHIEEVRTEIEKGDYSIAAWGEIYKTEKDAKKGKPGKT